MKVLFLQHGLGYGGATKSLYNTMKILHNHHELYLVTLPVSKKTRKLISEFVKLATFKELNIPNIYSFAYGTISKKGFNKARTFYPKKLIEYINQEQIDIVHINSSLFSNILGILKARTKAKIIVHIRELLPTKDSCVDRYIIDETTRHADRILFISDNEARFFLPSPKNIILPNSHDFSETNNLQKKGELSSTIVVGMCANFLRQKGHIVFVHAAHIASHSVDGEIVFNIVGYPEPQKRFDIKSLAINILKAGYVNTFHNRIKKFSLANLVLTPFDFDTQQHVATFDVYVRPDLTGHPWGRDIIEAMALKKPVIATGTSEFFIENGITGFLVPPNDPQKLAEKIIQLIKDPDLRLKMGVAGYEKVKKLCNINDYGEKIMSIYKSLVSES